MSRYRDILMHGEEVLKKADIADPKTDAWILLSEVSKMSRTKYLMESMEECDSMLEEQYNEVIARRAEHEPLQYITGHQEFDGIDIKVNENVLIPRFDTEILVEQALHYIKDGDRVLDMCTGSGCIICAIAKNSNISHGTGADLSDGAVRVAKDNVVYNDIDNVDIIKSDLFDNVREQYNVIGSNPPYIRPEVIAELDSEVKDREPYMALCGHEDGLYFYKEITKKAKSYLKSGGILLYEIGCDQAADVVQIMRQNDYKEIEVIKDLAGLDRIVKGRL